MAVAVGTKDRRHEIQLQLALALAYRNTGEVARSKEVAERATKIAVENGTESSGSRPARTSSGLPF